MHENVLSRSGRKLLADLARDRSPALRGWILAGGSGLALHFGHRMSEDLDFFRADNLDVRRLHDVFRRQGPYETLQEAEHTLTVICRRTKLSFFRVGEPFLFDPAPFRFFAVAHVRDIALMKLIAISGRGSRRDFIDLYSILRREADLRECLDLLTCKYGAGRVNAYHILKSLTYFDDAEAEPMPKMLEPFNWGECKAFFVREARAIVLG